MAVDLASRLRKRAAGEGLVLSDSLILKLVAYFELLDRWNRKINLTSLSGPDEAIDRLLLEPVAAAKLLPAQSRLADLGSGGGSPAIPLALALHATRLLMVEARARKAAFLREALRELAIAGTVEAARFEEVALKSDYIGGFDVVSARAVRADDSMLASAKALLGPGAVIALFRGPAGTAAPLFSVSNLAWRQTEPLLRSTGGRLSLLFHGR